MTEITNLVSKFYLHWYNVRKHAHGKAELVPLMKRMCEVLGKRLDGRPVGWEQVAPDYEFSGGFGNYHHMRLSKGLYITRYDKTMDYLNADENEDIYNIFYNLSNDRYKQHEGIFVKTRPYNLFCLQMIYPKDYFNTLAAMKWATENKQYTLFKTHPAADYHQNYPRFWIHAKQKGYVTEYTKFCHGYRSKELVEEANLIFSSDSALSFKALIKNKPTFMMRTGPMVDLIPIIPKLDSSVLDVKPVEQTHRTKWLNWFYAVICNDMNDNRFEEKINYRIDLYEDGKKDIEVCTWNTFKNRGLIL